MQTIIMLPKVIVAVVVVVNAESATVSRLITRTFIVFSCFIAFVFFPLCFCVVQENYSISPQPIKLPQFFFSLFFFFFSFSSVARTIWCETRSGKIKCIAYSAAAAAAT